MNDENVLITQTPPLHSFPLSSRGHPSTPRPSFKQDIVDTKAPMERAHLYEYDLYVYPTDS